MEDDNTEGMQLRIGVIQDYSTDMVHLRLYDWNNKSDPHKNLAFCGLTREVWYTPKEVDWPHERVCVTCFAGFKLVGDQGQALRVHGL